MLRWHLATCLLASALIAPALAQQQPDATRPAAPSATQQPGMTGSPTTDKVQPLAAPESNQMLGSDLRGTAVYGAGDEKIGSIDDFLIDQKGQIVAAIIGVGGFLGIGEKSVAIPFQAFQFMPERPAAGGAPSTKTTMDPDRANLRGMTRADLEAAPTFQKQTPRTGTATGTGTTGATGGPVGSTRPAAPAR